MYTRRALSWGRTRRVSHIRSESGHFSQIPVCTVQPGHDGHAVNFDEAMRRQTLYKTEEGRAMLQLQEGDTHHGGCGNC